MFFQSRVVRERNIPTGVGRRLSAYVARPVSSEHPHGRGEKYATTWQTPSPRGTSPRAWGEARRRRRSRRRRWNIPTGVGRRERRNGASASFPEHPHGRGEKSPNAAAVSTSTGTSPRAWGEGTPPGAPVFSCRNIPTGVGRSVLAPGDPGAKLEHPHGRGEKRGLRVVNHGRTGTSPRAWGEAAAAARTTAGGRNIPTGVGRSPAASAARLPWAEHPHGRGEKGAIAGRPVRVLGTSPRAWGEADLRRVLLQQFRNIPTGVGRSRRPATRCCPGSEHPHGRGEKAMKRTLTTVDLGTSPRAWGEAGAPPIRAQESRNIPTGVGRREARPGGEPVKPEHPHGRGEKAHVV